MKGTTELLPLARGEADLLRLALARLAAITGCRQQAAQGLLKRLAAGTIGGQEFAVLQCLLEREYTLRLLVMAQHASAAEPDASSPNLDTLEALRAKLEGSSPPPSD